MHRAAQKLFICGIPYRLDVAVELWTSSVEYRDSTPTLRVSGISVELGGLDSVVKSWEIIVVFISAFP